LPELHAKLDEMHLYKLLLSCWFHSLFAYPALPWEATARIWDLFLVFDFRMLVRVAFAILHRHQQELLLMDFTGLVTFCKEFNQVDEELIDIAFEVQLNDTYLDPLADLSTYHDYLKFTEWREKEEKREQANALLDTKQEEASIVQNEKPESEPQNDVENKEKEGKAEENENVKELDQSMKSAASSVQSKSKSKDEAEDDTIGNEDDDVD
jgi:hypothetical protein